MREIGGRGEGWGGGGRARRGSGGGGGGGGSTVLRERDKVFGLGWKGRWREGVRGWRKERREGRE